MNEIKLKTGSAPSKIFIGKSLNSLSDLTGNSRAVMITDENLIKHYGSVLPGFPYIVLKPGEETKSLGTIGFLTGELLKMEADRDTLLIGIGGGVVCDITGFTASVFKRGARLAFVATSLIAQSDAAIGGKNGVNYGNDKNIIGAFKQPEFVISDPAMLKTLPPDELASGFAEIIKTALIGDRKVIELLKKKDLDYYRNNPKKLIKIIYRTAKVKAAIVSADEHDHGIRRMLNFGHTIGHALERLYGLKHGQAVSIGMITELKILERSGEISNSDIHELEELLPKYNLNAALDFDTEKIKNILKNDKKISGGNIFLPIPAGSGKAAFLETGIDEILRYIHL